MSEEGGGASRSTDPAAGSSAATDVSLREYFNEKINSDRKLNNERFLFGGVLGSVIWFFIERHLAELNHENARVASVTERSVSQDTYDANEQQRKKEADELREWRKQKDQEATQGVSREEFNRDVKGDKRQSFDTTTKLIALGVSIVVVGLALLNYQALHNQPVVVTPTVTAPTK